MERKTKYPCSLPALLYRHFSDVWFPATAAFRMETERFILHGAPIFFARLGSFVAVLMH